MSSLVVGGVVIPVAVSSPNWNRLDAVDRARMFDNSYAASQAGGAANEWQFSTPPVTTALAATYKAALGIVSPQLCSGDILELPTMCCAEYQGGTPVRTAVGHRVVINFSLHEVQPAKLLLKYAPGDTITGESFSRSTVGYQTDANGLLVSKAINVKRGGHYIGGVVSTLLEGAAANQVIWNRDLTNGAWAPVNMTTAHTSTGADGTANGATRITATAGNATVSQNFTLASSQRFQSAYVKRITGTGIINMTTDGAAGDWQPITCTAGWTRVTVPSKTVLNPIVGFQIVTNGDAIDVDFVQNEDGPGSSPIATTTVAVTRTADVYSLPFTTPPQEMTVYAKFVEGGTATVVNGRIWQISSAGGAAALFAGLIEAPYYEAYTHNGTTDVASRLAVGPSSGNTVELSSRLFGDGSIDTTQSINGAAATVSTQSAANALATAWSGLLLWLNSAGTGAAFGFTALQSFKIVAGARSLAEMRTA